jgi:hypothetical protein
MRDGGLAKPHPHSIEILEIGIRKVWVPLRKIVDRLVHPMLLIFFPGLENPTSIDVAEELVTSPGHHSFLGHNDLHLSLLGAVLARSRYVW